MIRIALFQWDGREAAERVVRLAAQGIEATYRPRRSVRFGEIRDSAPQAAVIDLTRMPSWGRYLGAVFREQKSLRSIPLVFIAGDPEKTAQVREMLPGAVLTTWPRLADALQRAIRNAASEPEFRPPSKPLAAKLRIREDSVVALLHAPTEIERVLGPLPKGARLQKKIEGADVVLAFVTSMAALGAQLPALAGKLERGRVLWVIWPKKKTGSRSTLTMPAIREAAVAIGLIDHKVVSLDGVWSGMAIARRRSSPGRAPDTE